MKDKSIRFQITLWFAAALALIVALTFFVILSVSSSVIQENVRNHLIETYGKSMWTEIEFLNSIDYEAQRR